MSSSTREEIREDFDALRAAVSRVVAHSYDALTTPERLALLERLEHETRRLRTPGHQLINQLAAQAAKEELGGSLRTALADRLRITRAEAGRRVDEAEAPHSPASGGTPTPANHAPTRITTPTASSAARTTRTTRSALAPR